MQNKVNMEDTISNENLKNRIICKACNTGNDASATRCRKCWGRLTQKGFNTKVEPELVSSSYETQYLNDYRKTIANRAMIKWVLGLTITLFLILAWIINVFQFNVNIETISPSSKVSNSQDINDWPMVQKNNHHTGLASENDFSISEGVKWKFTTTDFIHTTPAIVENTIYIGTGDNKIIALDTNNGNVIWENTVNSPVDVSLSLTKDIAYASLRDGRILALDRKNGKEIWSYDTGEAIFGSVTIHNGAVYGGNTGKRIFSIDAKTGELLWDYFTESWVITAPAVKDNVVAVGSDDSYFYLLNAQNGNLRYKLKLGSGENTPTIIDDTAYFTTATRFGSRLNSFNIQRKNVRFAQGFIRWWFQLYAWNMASKPANPIGYNWGVELRRETGGFQIRNEQVRSNLATDGKYIYVNTFEGNIRSIDIKNGDTLWKISKSANIQSSPILSGSTLVQLMNNGTIYGINKNDGSIMWEYMLNEAIYGSAILVNDTLYVPTVEGNLYALG